MSRAKDDEKVGLDEILVLLDEFVGYEPEVKYLSNGEVKKVEHIIAKNTWRKYVHLYNEFANPKIEKIGNTKGTQYWFSDVMKVFEYKYTRERIENLWFTKTQYVVKKEKTKNNYGIDQELWNLFESDIPDEVRLSQEEFFEKVALLRKDDPSLKNEPVSRIAKIMDEERVESYKINVSSTQYSDISEEHKQDLLKIFDLDVYKNLCANSDGVNRFNIIFAIKKEVREKIVEMEKYDRIDNILFAVERNNIEEENIVSVSQEDLFEEEFYIEDDELLEELRKEFEESGGRGLMLLPDENEKES